MTQATSATCNYYEILEIPSDADEREIKRAYYKLARRHHPDKAASPDELRQFEEQFAQISAAYNTLKDETKREAYDRKLKSEPVKPPSASPRPTASAAAIAAGRSNPSDANRRDQGAQRQLGVTPEKTAIAQKAYARGMQLYKEGNYAKAIDFFEAAIQNNDAEAVYHARLATSLIEARKSATRAIDAAQKAIDLDPYNLEHKFDMAYIFERIGSKTNALRVYEDILRWDAGNHRAQAGIAALNKRKSIFSAGSPGMQAAASSLKDQFNNFLSKFRKS
ncbi:DnaJ domain-containing protein [bacterium]|nr:DnaJ domain-containing protein [bacterium]